MLRTLLACAATVALTVVLIDATGAGGAQGFKPPCPRGTYSPDGNFSPVKCTIANPAALAFYGKLLPPLFALGANATPSQVLAAIRRSGYVTPPELCTAYHLAAFAEGWHFTALDMTLPFKRGGTINCAQLGLNH